MESRTLTGSDQSAALQNPSYFLYGPENAKIQDHPVPQIDDPHDVLIRIAFTGVCGSDVSFIHPRPVNQQLILRRSTSGHTAESVLEKSAPPSPS